ncbi:MAG: extracellular solute-binding protein [Bacillota bacterium]|jgi:spermidine/putrescine transport system permease protein|nr:extracellular solute-binding protein [Bacillota bacterium]
MIKKNSKSSLLNIYSLIIYLIIYIPIIILIIFSFNDSKINAVWEGFTFKWYMELFDDKEIISAMTNSLTVAFLSSLISTVIGTLAAVGMYKYKFRGKTVLDGLLYVPIIIPEIVMGIALLMFFSQLKITTGLLTLILAHTTFSLSYVVIVVKAKLESFDSSLEEAAMDLGATPFQTFYKITLPIIAPGILAGALLAFTLSMDDVIVSFFVSGPGFTTLPLKIFSMVKFGVSPEINALSTIMLIITLSIALFSESLRNNSDFEKEKNNKKIILKEKFNLKNIKKFATFIISVLLVTSVLTGCSSSNKESSKKEEVLNVFNWSEYLPQEVIDKFEEKYNIKVNYTTYASNEEMLAKLMAGGSQFDIAVSSDYMVDVMRNQNLIQEINMDNIPNYKNIGDEFKSLSFDPENKYTVPYMWGNAVVAVNTKMFDEEIDSYADLWDSKFNNSMVVLDDQRAIIGLALKKLGYSFNETDPAKLEQAKVELMKLKENIKIFDSDSPKTSLINGEAAVGYVWGAEAVLAQAENPDIKVFFPKEGIYLWQDNFVIPSGAENKENAELFINFLLEPEISAEISKSFPYANPNTEAHKLMDKETLENKAIYPDSDIIKKGEHLKDLGETTVLYDQIWTELKSN